MNKILGISIFTNIIMISLFIKINNPYNYFNNKKYNKITNNYVYSDNKYNKKSIIMKQQILNNTYLIITEQQFEQHTLIDLNITNNDIIISYIYCSIINTNSDKSCHIEFLRTDKNHKNKGYGSTLLQQLKTFCMINNITKITLKNCLVNSNKYDNLYTKNGFVYTGNNNNMEYIINKKEVSFVNNKIV